MTTTVTFYDAKLLYRYFDRRAKASIGLDTFRLGQVVWGKGNTTLVNGVPSVAAIPSNLAAVEGVFLTNTPVFTYLNGRITVREGRLARIDEEATAREARVVCEKYLEQ